MRSVGLSRLMPLALAAAVVVASPIAAHAIARPKLARAIQRAIGASHLGRLTGVLVQGVGESDSVVRRSARRRFIPASTMKLITASAALERLGPSYRWRTTASCESTPTTSGVVGGDLYLVGHGDPTLGTRARARRVGISPRGSYLDDLAGSIKARGIVRIDGGIVADESFFDKRRTGPHWKASYAAANPPLSALSVDRNYADKGGWERAPALAAARRLRAMLIDRGIGIGGGLRLGREPTHHYTIATEYSPQLYRVITAMDRASDNFAAEMLEKTLGREKRHAGTTLAGARVAASELTSAGAAPGQCTLVDGSGLSRDNRLPPQTLARLLQYAKTRPFGRILLSSLPVAGTSGTLKDRMRGTAAQGRVFAKTGSLLGVSTLAGYANSRGGGRFVVVIMTNGADTLAGRALQDRICEVLAAYPGR